MKKILLIPTTLVAAVTPIIATTSCNDSNKVTEIKLTEFYKEHDNPHDNCWITTKEPQDFVKKTKYIVNVDMSNFTSTTPNHCGFWLCKQIPETSDMPYEAPKLTKPDVFVDGEELMEVTRDQDFKVNTFRLFINLDTNQSVIEIGKDTIQKNSVFKIEFEFNDDDGKFYPIFQNWEQNI